MQGASLSLAHVWKKFRLGSSSDSLGELLVAGWRRLRGRRGVETDARDFWALRDLDFSLRAGESLGIVGPNGAGKSTALKLLAGILRPDRGRIEVHGRLASLIEVGAGFHGDLTGRENIYLNGAILGMRRREIQAKLDAIVAFAGLERFIDTPVKRYSSGMYARLGFSIAAHVDPDILLVDEVLSVGDAMFRLRCEQRMRELVERGTALVFVTHNLEQMVSICPRAIVLDRGGCAFDGDARRAVDHYMRAMSQDFVERPTDIAAGNTAHQAGCRAELAFRTADGTPASWIRAGQPLVARVTLHTASPRQAVALEVAARLTAGENLLCFNSARAGRTFPCAAGENHYDLHLPTVPLAGGRYFWNVRAWDAATGETLVTAPFKFPLIVDDDGRATGAFCVPHSWHGQLDAPVPCSTAVTGAAV